MPKRFPKTVRAFWKSYLRQVLPPNAAKIQQQECQRAFYAGAQAVMRINYEIGDADLPEMEAVKILSAVNRELDAFAQEQLTWNTGTTETPPTQH